jgi:hypothetical protein
MKKIISFLFCAVFFLNIFLNIAVASEARIDCSNRFATVINPIRGRNLWINKSMQPIEDQYKAIKDNNLSATWLLQSDVLQDKELLKYIKNFDDNQERGIFLEVSQKLADSAKVIYPYNVAWFKPQAVFLSGYSQSERRLLIEEMFREFKNEFGHFPKSVGAWWIDSYSLSYMKNKYGITSALIVADQTTTDSYGVWGQWWGVPYYPSKINILNPAKNSSDKEDVVILQWAQRDPLLAYGNGPLFSNYSIQANDYIRQGKDTSYFKEIAGVYLDCTHQVGQITVGLETGIESVGYMNEYKNQMRYLKETKIKSITMSGFAQKFKETYPEVLNEAQINYKDSIWRLSKDKRENQKLNDRIEYTPIAFKDYFVSDKDEFLDRKLPLKNSQSKAPWSLIPVTILALGAFSFWKKKLEVFLTALLFSTAAYGLLLKSFYLFGWKVYFGPVVLNLYPVQILTILIVYALCLLVFEKVKFIQKSLWIFLPISFAFDPLIQTFRYSYISGKHYLGFAMNALNFIGVTFSNNKIEFINTDLPAYQAAALLRINFSKIYENQIAYFLVSPLVHLLISLLIIYLLNKLPFKIRYVLMAVFLFLFLTYLVTILNADPRVALPST